MKLTYSSSITTIETKIDHKIGRIFVGDGILIEALASLKKKRFFLVSEPIVWRHHGEALTAVLEDLGIDYTLVMLPEKTLLKSFSTLEWLCEHILSRGLRRENGILSFGGGVVCDVVGLAASLLHRGLDVVHIPTTFLAQVDAAIGGKTAINTSHGKNLVGTFHQPIAVVCDVALLKTLSQDMMRCGYGEVVKYGMLGDETFFSWLENHGGDVLSCRDPVREAVERSCRYKSMIVEKDAQENAQRALLNLGHTFAHGLEAASKWRIMHGYAVSVGLCLAAWFSQTLGFCHESVPRRLVSHLRTHRLPTKIEHLSLKTTPEKLLNVMMQDKKNHHDGLRFVLLREIGEAFLHVSSIEVVRAFLESHLSSGQGKER